MKKLDQIFEVFSRRGRPDQPFTYNIPPSFRNRVIMLCRDTFSNKYNPASTGNYIDTFWREVHRMLTYRHGRPQLTIAAPFISETMDTANFLTTCKGEEFLDFIEYVFQVGCLFHVVQEENDLVEEVNKLFAIDALGYELTNFAYEEQMEETRQFETRKVRITTAWPQVIRKDDQAIHETAVKPALQFLSDPAFKSANLEYLEALKDYRDGKWGNSLTMCGSAFESVMKVICEKKKWTYAQDDTADTLIKIIVAKAGLETHFIQQLITIATLRNKYSKSHGAGAQPRKVTPGIALFGLNLTASAILFLAKETGLN